MKDFTPDFSRNPISFCSENDSLPSFVLGFMIICCICFIKEKNDKLFELTGRPSCYLFSYFHRFYYGKMADSDPELLYSNIDIV